MLAFRNEYLAGKENEKLTIVDLGSCDVNGSYKPLFDSKNWNYIGIDMSPGKNVDIVLRNPYSWEEIQSDSVDVLISGQAFEHIEYFWVTMLEISRVMKPGGICCIIAPSSGEEHGYPVDCWRFYPDGFRALAHFARLEVISVKTQWEDLGYSDGGDRFHDSTLICCKPTSLQTEKEDIFKYHVGQLSHDKILKYVGKGKKVLEFGCSTGYVTRFLKEELNCQVTAIEIDPDAAEHASKYCERLIIGDADYIDYKQYFGNEKFDVIIFGDVLEHLKYPDKVLVGINDFIAESGYILASIPNIAHFSIIVELFNGRFDYKEYGLLDRTHLRFFTRESIYNLFESSGYMVSIVDTVDRSPREAEFKTNLQYFPSDLLSYIYSHNRDAETYQFIIRAVNIRQKIKGMVGGGKESKL
jgi:SAM-dependent methyltransferase